MAESAATLAVLAQDAPARLQQELSLFWEEVEREAERLERQQGAAGEGSMGRGNSDPQDQIDALRAQVAELCRRLEARPQGRG
ncbi:MAG: hypothetical protein ACK550_04875 [Synechococcaceae cyanobacterium]